MSGDHPAKQLGESAIVQVSALELLWADLQKLFRTWSSFGASFLLHIDHLPLSWWIWTTCDRRRGNRHHGNYQRGNVRASSTARARSSPWPPLSSVDAARLLLYPINCIWL